MNESSIYESLGVAVASHRKRLQLTQTQLSSRIGLSRASIANIERGRQKVLLHHVYLLASALNLPSIMSLVPTALLKAEADYELPVSRSDISEKQKAQVNDVIMAALASRTANLKG